MRDDEQIERECGRCDHGTCVDVSSKHNMHRVRCRDCGSEYDTATIDAREVRRRLEAAGREA